MYLCCTFYNNLLFIKYRSEFVENINNQKFIIRKIRTYKKMDGQKYKKAKNGKKNLSYARYKQDCGAPRKVA